MKRIFCEQHQAEEATVRELPAWGQRTAIAMQRCRCRDCEQRAALVINMLGKRLARGLA